MRAEDHRYFEQQEGRLAKAGGKKELQAKDQTVFDQLLNSDSKSASTLLQAFALGDPVMKQKLAIATNSTVLRKK